MKKDRKSLFGAFGAVLAAVGAGHGEASAQAGSPAPVTSADVVITGDIKYRNRTNETAPVLTYDLTYFQRFEPLTVGDMLKRVPSAAFVSDVLEYDGLRLRGIDPGYTQVLINGEEAPGGEADRSFFVDRIPAELVERVEIIRSPSANRSGDAVAGALNIVLRDSYTLDGGFLRAGGLYFDDGDIKPTLGAVYSTRLGDMGLLVGANMQGRYNPKKKETNAFTPPGGGAPVEFDERELQADTRDGTDYSFNAAVNLPIGGGKLDVTGLFVRTDRTEDEVSRLFGDPIDTSVMDELALQHEDIQEDNYAVEADLRLPMLGGESKFEIGRAAFISDISELETATEFDTFPTDGEVEQTLTQSETDDVEWSATLAHKRGLGAAKIEFGVDLERKTRETYEIDDDQDSGGVVALPFAFSPLGPLTPGPGDIFTIKERRADPFAMISGGETFQWEFGLRYEVTEVKVSGAQKRDFATLLPSAHGVWNLTDDDRIKMSAAKTLRRPNFDQLSPILLEEEPTEDNDLVGNPLLQPEQALGFDFGYERRIGSSGVAGVNVFYRKIDDLIELANTGVVSSEGSGFVLQPRNVGDGTVWGVEFDLSAPLTFIGLPDTGVFLNYSLIESEVDDVFGKRSFNDQAESIFNVGFIQDVPSLGAAFGATYRKQGDAFSRIIGETVKTTYGADLEAFVEKRFGEKFVLRLTGSNLLDASKDETINAWETQADQASGDIDDLDSLERETEKSGPVVQLVGRLAF